MELSEPDDPIDASSHLRGTACHEAGHAVVARSLKLHVESINLREIGGGDSETKTDHPDHLSLIDQLAVLAAGREAELMFDSPLPEWMSCRDRAKAIDLVLRLIPGIELDEVPTHLAAGHARARELLIEDQDRVVRLAARLREVRQVDAAEFLRLMEV
jgi:ATP-dependent Zn protease